jgi:aconitate hydratase
VRAVIARSFERIHRSNLAGMGVLPLQFKDGQSPETLGLTGRGFYEIDPPAELQPGQELTVVATNPAEDQHLEFQVICRLDTPVEIEYYRHGGVLPMVMRNLLNE